VESIGVEILAMRTKPKPTLWNRAVATLAVVSFVAFTLWAGVCVRERPAPSPEMLSARPIPLRREHTGALRIIAGPELIIEGDKKTVWWETSAPADSLVTYGRSDPFEHPLVKDPRLTEKHRFDLSEQPFIEFCRFRVMSSDGAGNVVTGGWGPGRGPQGTVLADVSREQPELCSPGGQAALAWADYDDDGDLDVALVSGAGDAVKARILRQTDGRFEDVTDRTCPGLAGSSACWGDFNADGNLDLLTCGDKLRLYASSRPAFPLRSVPRKPCSSTSTATVWRTFSRRSRAGSRWRS
jgi:hypothetical protein